MDVRLKPTNAETNYATGTAPRPRGTACVHGKHPRTWSHAKKLPISWSLPGERGPGCHHQWRSSAEDYPAASLRGGARGGGEGCHYQPARLPSHRDAAKPRSPAKRQAVRICLFVWVCARAFGPSNSIGPRQEIRAAVLASFQGQSERDAERGCSDWGRTEKVSRG